MSQVVTHIRSAPLTPGLRANARALHRPAVSLLHPGWICVGAAVGLSLIGVAAIATTKPEDAFGHVVHWCVGMLAALLVALPHYRRIPRLSYPLLGVVVALLIFVLIGPEAIVRPRNGAYRWISLGVTDFQPSELAKIAYVLALASYLRFRSNYRRLPGLLLPLGLTFIPLGLVLVEPDLGTALLFLPTLFAMLIAAGAKLRHIGLVIATGLVAAPAMYPLLQPHQQDRIKAMVAQVKGDPQYELGIGYQGDRAVTLVGAGGVTGVGRQHAADLLYSNRLPFEHNDMIFAVICCRWGLLGGLVTWGLFVMLGLGAFLAAGQCKDPFARLVAVGVAASLMAQMLINTGMTTGLMPITGMTLPFVSYGGSSMVSAWIMIGLLLNIAMRRSRNMGPEAFDFDESEEG